MCSVKTPQPVKKALPVNPDETGNGFEGQVFVSLWGGNLEDVLVPVSLLLHLLA
jgi:hypothetical protein